MTIQLTGIISPFSSMTDEEKVELIRRIRHVKMVEKPDIKARRTKTAKKTAAKRTEKAKKDINSLVKNMSKDQILALMKELQN